MVTIVILQRAPAAEDAPPRFDAHAVPAPGAAPAAAVMDEEAAEVGAFLTRFDPGEVGHVELRDRDGRILETLGYDDALGRFAVGG